jgi:hypothetical protein
VKITVFSQVLRTICDSILDRELLLLSVVEFQFHPSHPYQYCMMILKRIFQEMDTNKEITGGAELSGEALSKMVQKEIAQYAWLMINDRFLENSVSHAVPNQFF